MRHLTDTHAHTVASTHAFSTVEEYFRAASDKGSVVQYYRSWPGDARLAPSMALWKYAGIASHSLWCGNA